MSSISNFEKWRVTFTSNPLSVSLSDSWGIKPRGQVIIHFQDNNDVSSSQLLEKKLSVIAAENNPHAFTVHKKDHLIYVIFGNYGLKGGGRTKAMVTGAALAAVGAGMMASPIGWVVLGGNILVSAGISGSLYAYKKKDEYTDKECFQKALYGGVGGLAGGSVGAIGRFLGIASIGSKMLTGALSNVASTTAQKGLDPSEKYHLSDLVASAAGGSLSAGINAAPFWNIFLKSEQIDDVTSALLLEFLRGGVKSGTSNVVGTVSSNVVEGKSLFEDIIVSLIIGSATGGLSGAFGEGHKRAYLQSVKSQFSEVTNLMQDKAILVYKQKLISLTNKGFVVSGFIDGDPKKGIVFQDPQGLKESVSSDCIQKKAIEIRQSLAKFHEVINFANREPIQSIPVSVNRPSVFSPDIPNDPVASIEPEWDELIQHIVLVHAIPHDDYMFTNFSQEQIDKFDHKRGENEPFYQALFVIKEAISPEGVIGNHRRFEEAKFKKNLISRPTEHWAWCQLVQPHIDSWENAAMAVLEPAATFENTEDHKLYGVAPYDTLSIGSHVLSKDAIILVPESIADELRSYLKNFKGKIVPYSHNKKLRVAVIEALKTYYPQTWHVCDERGTLIGEKEIKTLAGYLPKTCIKKPDGTIIQLIQNEGRRSEERLSKAFRNISQKRFVGLHNNSTIFVIENDRNNYFKTLTEFKKDHSIARDNPLFAGKVEQPEDLKNLGIFEAYKLYKDLLNGGNNSTNTHQLAEYIIIQSIYADLVSIFYKNFPSENFVLTTFDLDVIITSLRMYFINALENMCNVPNSLSSFEFFKIYRDLHINGISTLVISKKKTKSFVSQKPESGSYQTVPLCLQVADQEWSEIQALVNLKVDLAEAWPPSDKMRNYIRHVLNTIPRDLKQLHAILHSLTLLNNVNETSKINFLKSLIQCVSFEVIFQNEIKLDNESDTLFSQKLINIDKDLVDFGLETEDFTRVAGDCLFDNVSKQLELSISTQDLRKKTVEYMKNHHEEYESKPDYSNNKIQIGEGSTELTYDNWEKYLECMLKPQVWATEVEIHALACMLERPIVLFKNSNPSIYNEHGRNQPIFLKHVNNNHFISCIPIKGLLLKEVFEIILKKA